MDKTIESSPSQSRAISSSWKNKVTLVLSTAGSGKTFVLTHRAIHIAKHLIQQGAKNKRILCICFNRSAADEMFDRVAQYVTDQRLSERIFVTRRSQYSSTSIMIEIRTFHSLGLWIIRTATVSDKKAVNLNDGNLKVIRGDELHQLTSDILSQSHETSQNEQPGQNLVRTTLQNISSFKRKDFDKCCEEYLLEGTSPFETFKPSAIFNKYEEALYTQCSVDFDDMIFKATQLVLKSPDLQRKLSNRYETILVDEFQDISASEMVICKAMVEQTKSLTLVGDDDQQIYTFRKSPTWIPHKVVVKLFAGHLQILTLHENRRCPPTIVACAKALINRNPDRYKKNMSALRLQGIPVSVIGCKSLKLEKKVLSSFLLRLLPRLNQKQARVLVLFRLRSTLKDFRVWLSNVGIQTTTKINVEKKKKPIGSVALSVFSVISLLSESTNSGTFTWILSALSPLLDESIINNIFDHEDKANSPYDSHQRKRLSIEEEMSSAYNKFPLLDALRSHFIDNAKTDYENRYGSSFHCLVNIIRIADRLRVQLRKVSGLQDLVSQAETLLRSQCAYNDEIIEENSENEDWNAQESDIRSRRLGFDCILSVAKRIDNDPRYETKYNDEQGSPGISVESVQNDDKDSEDDFAALFTQDSVSRVRKRRKGYGVSQARPSSRGLNKDERDNLKSKINVFHKDVYKMFRTNQYIQRKVRQLKENPIVVLSTIHKAKGSTFPFVILCGADDDTIPYHAVSEQSAILSSGNIPTQDTGFTDSAHCQEERRLAFVAMTRAQDQFLCTYSSRGVGEHIGACQSRFLREMKCDVENQNANFAEHFIEHERDIDSSNIFRIALK